MTDSNSLSFITFVGQDDPLFNKKSLQAHLAIPSLRNRGADPFIWTTLVDLTSSVTNKQSFEAVLLKSESRENETKTFKC